MSRGRAWWQRPNILTAIVGAALGYALGHFYGGSHLVGGTDLWESFGKNRTESGFAREIVSATAAPLAVRPFLARDCWIDRALRGPFRHSLGHHEQLYGHRSGKGHKPRCRRARHC